MRLPRFISVFALTLMAGLLSQPPAQAETDADLRAALALFAAKQYPDARIALEKIVASRPTNATACHYLGRVLIARTDPAAFETGLQWLARAAELEPGNVSFLGIYGGAALQHAGRTNSLSSATQGRDAMERALTLDPGYLDAREALFYFYHRAPWPIGSSAKAALHLTGIRERDPDRATALEVLSKANARDYSAAFQICEAALAKNPDNYVALYQYGRTASISDRNLERGLSCLQRCLTLTPPTPASPTPSHVWQRIGNLQEKRQRPAEARTAYQTALELDPGNRQARDALSRLP